MTWKDALKSPVAWAASLVGLAPLVHDVAATAGLWFPTISTFSTLVAPRIDWIPTSLTDKLLLVAALVYLAILSDKLLEKTT